MSNMSYCRMENTYQDLQDVFENWDEVTSNLEKKYKDKILELCKDIVNNYYDNEDEGL